MTDPLLWQCRTVADLPQVLAFYAGKSSSQTESDSTPSAFPGVVVTLGDCLAGFVGFGVESHGTLSITNPIFLIPQQESLRSAMFSLMLETVCDQATRLQCGTLRSVQPHELPGEVMWVTEALRNGLFRIRGTVVRWHLVVTRASSGHFITPLSSPVRPDTDSKAAVFQLLNTRRLQEEDTLREQTSELLRRILADSTDLPNLPVPRPEDMLSEWMADDALLLIARLGETAAGLLVFTEDPDADDHQAGSFRIQYIGVRPDRRQKGIASGMLRRTLEELNRSERCKLASKIRISVYADRENRAASALYQRNEFRPAEVHDIWCRDLNQD